MHEAPRLCGTARTVYWTDQQSATIRIDGEVCATSAGLLLAGCEQDMRLTRPRVLVAHYEHARLVVTADSLAQAAVQVVHPGAALRLPTALVVRPDDFEAMRAYCDIMGRQGILRAAFTNAAEARQWAAEYAALWEAQARWATRGAVLQ
jgi:hypothetical protein